MDNEQKAYTVTAHMDTSQIEESMSILKEFIETIEKANLLLDRLASRREIEITIKDL